MLESLKLRNFTVFEEADFHFAPGLNVLVGENGTGKTHVLKVAYSAISAPGSLTLSSETRLNDSLADKLFGVFKPDKLGRLVRQHSKDSVSEVTCAFEEGGGDLSFLLTSTSEGELKITSILLVITKAKAVYFPARELLSIYPGFVSLYEERLVPFEETWRDTCRLLGAPLIKSSPSLFRDLLVPLESALGGKVTLEPQGGFYLSTDNSKTEIHLVAEGHRKLAMLAQLLANGSIAKGNYLFWDEPEANLNPQVIKLVAKLILHLCLHNIQVFVASHSLFLLRELDILLQTKEFKSVPARFFGLHSTNAGVEVQQGSSIDDIGEIASLQEELSQSDRYLESEA